MIKTMRAIAKNVGIDFRYLLAQKKTYMILVIILVFGWWGTAGLLQASITEKVRVAPWVLPEYFANPAMLMMYGFLTIMVFADIPYNNPMSRMIEIRSGRKNWIVSQMIYTVALAFFYSLAFAVSTVIFLLPRIYLTTGWGELLTRVAERKIEGLNQVSTPMVEHYRPLTAVAVTFLCIWGVSVFMAMLIFFLRMFISHSVGIAVAGFFAFFSYFANFMNSLSASEFWYRISPLNWLCLYNIDPVFEYGSVPGQWYVGVFLVAGSLVFAAAGSIWYLRGHEIR